MTNQPQNTSWLHRNSHWIGLTADMLAIGLFLNPELRISGVGLVLAGLVLSLLGVIGGALNLGTQSRIGKVFAHLALVLGLLGTLYFLPTTITRLFFTNPSSYGEEYRTATTEKFQMAAGADTDQLVGVYQIQFKQPEEAVEVVLSFSREDSKHLQSFVISQTVGGDDRVSTLNNLTHGEIGVFIAPVEAEETVTLSLKATLNPGAPLTQSQLRVTTSYYKRSTLWEFKRCVFRRYP